MKLMIGKKLRKGERVKIRSDLKIGAYNIMTGEHSLNPPADWESIPCNELDSILAGKVTTITEAFDEGHNGFYCKLNGGHGYWHGCLLEMMETITCRECGKEACSDCGICLHCLSKSYIEKLKEFYLSVREMCKEHPMMTDRINHLWHGFMKEKRSSTRRGEKYSIEEFPEKFFETR